MLDHPGLHRPQHISFLGGALVFWWAMLERRPRAPGPAFGHLLVTSIHASLLGALFLFAAALVPAADARCAGLRIYIAGVVSNSAANLVRWIEDPPAQAPGTAMPRTGVTGQQARDIAAYLYTLR